MGKRQLTRVLKLCRTGKRVPEYQCTSAAKSTGGHLTAARVAARGTGETPSPPQPGQVLGALPIRPETPVKPLNGQNPYSMSCGIHRHLLFLVRITPTSIPNINLTICQQETCPAEQRLYSGTRLPVRQSFKTRGKLALTHATHPYPSLPPCRSTRLCRKTHFL